MQGFVNGMEAYLGASIPLAVIAAFAGGVLASLTPCVYPMIPIVSTYVGSKTVGERTRGKAFALSLSDSPRKAQAYRDRHKVDYPIAFDYESRVSRAFGILGTPTILIIDKGGTVRYRDAAVPEDLAQHFAKLME